MTMLVGKQTTVVLCHVYDLMQYAPCIKAPPSLRLDARRPLNPMGSSEGVRDNLTNRPALFPAEQRTSPEETGRRRHCGYLSCF